MSELPALRQALEWKKIVHKKFLPPMPQKKILSYPVLKTNYAQVYLPNLR